MVGYTDCFLPFDLSVTMLVKIQSLAVTKQDKIFK